MKIAVIGGGGREHALCWKLKQSPRLTALYALPGNAGIAAVAQCIPIAATDYPAILAWCEHQRPDLVIVAPDNPLVDGLVDKLQASGIKAFGPNAAAARLEGSKAFTKDFCRQHDIPTPRYQHFSSLEPALAYLADHPYPLVVKADGLAYGKGVVIAETYAVATQAVTESLHDGKFGTAGATVVIEEFVVGDELSFFALCDGSTAIPLATAEDHKRAFDNDQGPNTGGMGAYSPSRFESPALTDQIMQRIILPTVKGMRQAGTPFIGVLYAGIMLRAGEPLLLEYNVRFGDPECQVIMPRLNNDLVSLLEAALTEQLQHTPAALAATVALTVVHASQGYPGTFKKNTLLKNVAAASQQALVFHASTAMVEGQLVATGGRVLNVTGLGDTVASARAQAYQASALIDWADGFYRRDIGVKALAPTGEKLS